jgi:hypothetical protein
MYLHAVRLCAPRLVGGAIGSITFRGKGELGDLKPRREQSFGTASAATEGSSSSAQQQQPAQAVPFLADVNQILAEYAASKRRKKKKTKARATTTATVVALPVAFSRLVKKRFQWRNLPRLQCVSNRSCYQEIMSHSSLDDIVMLNADTLLATLQVQGRIHRSERSSPRISIEQLRNLEDLQIEHTKRGTFVESAMEMERSANEALEKARREYDSLAYSIPCAQQNLKGGPVKQLTLNGDSSFSHRSEQARVSGTGK